MLRIHYIGITMFTLRLVVETIEVDEKWEQPMDSYLEPKSTFCADINARLNQGST